MNTALLLIDIQNDYFPGGAWELSHADEAAAQARLALGRFREQHRPVFHVRHINTRPGAAFFLPDTDIPRSLIWVEKLMRTPQMYPRKAGTPSKSPLE